MLRWNNVQCRYLYLRLFHLAIYLTNFSSSFKNEKLDKIATHNRYLEGLFTIMLSVIRCSPNWSLPFRILFVLNFRMKFFICPLCFIFPALFGHADIINIWLKAHITMFLFMQVYPCLCYVFPLTSVYSLSTLFSNVLNLHFLS